MLSRAYPDHAGKHLAGLEAVETMRLYQRILEDIPDAIVESATIDHISSSQWFPKPSELRERCAALIANDADSIGGVEAWGVVVRRLAAPEKTWVNGVQYVRRPCDDVTERAVKAIGGWSYLNRSEDAMADRARFVEAYKDIVARERRKIAEHPVVTEARLALAERKHLEELSDGRDTAG
jgi:hypothetical protein